MPLEPHSGGPGKAGYPFYGAAYPAGTQFKEKFANTLTRPPTPPLATGSEGPVPNKPEVRGGPATDFYGAQTRYPAIDPETGLVDTMQPPVFNQFKSMKDEAGKAKVNGPLQQATGPLQVGSSGQGASHGRLPITTTDGIHKSQDPVGNHGTIDVDPDRIGDIAPGTNGTIHLYPNGSSSTVPPRPAGAPVGPATYIPNKSGKIAQPIYPGLKEIPYVGSGSYFPDPAGVKAAFVGAPTGGAAAASEGGSTGGAAVASEGGSTAGAVTPPATTGPAPAE